MEHKAFHLFNNSCFKAITVVLKFSVAVVVCYLNPEPLDQAASTWVLGTGTQDPPALERGGRAEALQACTGPKNLRKIRVGAAGPRKKRNTSGAVVLSRQEKLENN